MNYANLYSRICAAVDKEKLLAAVERLHAAELKQTHSAHCRAAATAAEMLREIGAEPETVDFPADGRSSFQDKFMPYAWEASEGRLTVVKSPFPFEDPVIADYERHPFHLICGSPALKKGGEYFKLITYEQLMHGTDGEKALVLLPPDSRPYGKCLRDALELGSAGVVSDYLRDRYLAPDGIAWANGNTMGTRWHFSIAEKNYLGFCVSPRTGDLLRQALRLGNVTVKAECDGKLFADRIPAVTAVLKGRSQEEVWLMAHLYEPLADDNSAGVCACIEIFRQLKKLIETGVIPRPEHTLRLVFAMELYGFAAFRERFREQQVLGAVNMDGMPVRVTDTGMKLFMAPPPLPCAGNALMRETLGQLRSRLPWEIEELDYGAFQDDQALSDPLAGVPVLWPLHAAGGHWHNSVQTLDIIDPGKLAAHIGFIGCWSAAMLGGVSSDGRALGRIYLESLRRLAALEPGRAFVSGLAHLRRAGEGIGGGTHGLTREEYARRTMYASGIFGRELEELGLDEEKAALEEEAAHLVEGYEPPEELPAAPGPWFAGGAHTVVTRLTRGLPHDFCRNPERREAMATIYSLTGRVLAGADGEKTLRQLLEEGAWQENSLLTEARVTEVCRELNELARWGYVSLDISNRLPKEEFREKLRQAGVVPGTLLMVHSALSALGPRAFTPAEANDMLLDAVGPEGTLLMPAFTEPFIYFEGGCEETRAYRPFTPERKPYTGALVNDLLTRRGSFRDAHTTHSIAGMGRDAAELLAAQGPFDAPTGEKSAWHRLAERGGKMLFIGTGVGCTTYLHYLETMLDLPYLTNAVVRYRNGEGRFQTALIPRHLGGCRDFYRGIGAKFFRRAAERGLKITCIPLGYAALHCMDCREFYDTGMELLREDPGLLLCDSEECHFCSNAAKLLKR